MKKLFLLWACLIVGAGSVCAQEITLSQAQVPAQVPFAKPFSARYQLAYPDGYHVTADEKSFSPDFEITQQAFSPQTGVYDLTAVPFALGKSTFTVTFLLTKDGKTVSQTAAEPTEIEIAPVQIFNDKKLREVRPARVPAGWQTWLVALLVLAALIYTIYYWKKRLSQSALRVNKQEDHRPCDEIALSKIEALLNSGLWERKAYKLFYITLCDILREYLWRQLRLDTSSDTSAELLRRVKKMDVMQPLLVPLKDFLNSGDLVKFAKAEPTETVRNKDVQILREIVKETTPKQEADK